MIENETACLGLIAYWQVKRKADYIKLNNEKIKDHTQGFTLKCGLYSCSRPKRIGQKLVFTLIPNRNSRSEGCLLYEQNFENMKNS